MPSLFHLFGKEAGRSLGQLELHLTYKIVRIPCTYDNSPDWISFGYNRRDNLRRKCTTFLVIGYALFAIPVLARFCNHHRLSAFHDSLDCLRNPLVEKLSLGSA